MTSLKDKYYSFSFLLITNTLSLYGDDSFFEAWQKTTLSGYGKMMYVYDDRLAPKLDQSTFGIGGKIGFDTGYWNELKVKAAYYTTNDLGFRNSNPKKTDTYMFDVDKNPYSVLGETALEYKNSSTTLLMGRQKIDSPIVSTYDYRIIPNLFEAYTLTYQSLLDTTFILSYITKMSGLDGLVSFKHFESMSQQTYTSLSMSDLQTVNSNEGQTLDISKISGNQGVVMSGIVYDNGIKGQGWNYYCPNVINEFYADFSYPYEFTKNLTTTFEIQGYSVRELGDFKRFLENLGLNSSYELYGIKLSLEQKDRGITASFAYNFFTGDGKTVTVFGNWGGYPEYVSIPYMFPQDNSVSAIAKSQMGKINFKFDLSKIGWENQIFIAGYSMIDLDESIMPESDINLINLIYKAKVTNALGFKVQYDWRDSQNYRYANDMLTFAATYVF